MAINSPKYVAHIDWCVPTHILYGENDSLTSFATISDFARRTDATLEVMPGGEHWFHTPEQMAFLDGWIQRIRPTFPNAIFL